MSNLAGLIRRLRVSVEQKLPQLLAPAGDEEKDKQQEVELAELRNQLVRLITELKSRDYMLGVESKNKSSDSWALKQRRANLEVEMNEAQGLVDVIEAALKSRGLDPMKAGKEISELLEQFHLPTENLNQLKHMLVHAEQHSQSIEPPSVPHVDALSQLVMLSSAMLSC